MILHVLIWVELFIFYLTFIPGNLKLASPFRFLFPLINPMLKVSDETIKVKYQLNICWLHENSNKKFY